MLNTIETPSTEAVFSEFAGDPDFRELLEMFVSTIPEKQSALREHFGAGRIEQLRVLAHQMKGAGGGYGFAGLSTRAAALEEACRTEEHTVIADALGELLAYSERVSC
ncbi:MAG TPA: Hpt domain-containing protein [Planctomycetaceae bacterium]|nr:Hpt domain-containing protein [Planctomycetaceae bacterium]